MWGNRQPVDWYHLAVRLLIRARAGAFSVAQFQVALVQIVGHELAESSDLNGEDAVGNCTNDEVDRHHKCLHGSS